MLTSLLWLVTLPDLQSVSPCPEMGSSSRLPPTLAWLANLVVVITYLFAWQMAIGKLDVANFVLPVALMVGGVGAGPLVTEYRTGAAPQYRPRALAPLSTSFSVTPAGTTAALCDLTVEFNWNRIEAPYLDCRILASDATPVSVLGRVRHDWTFFARIGRCYMV